MHKQAPSIGTHCSSFSPWHRLIIAACSVSDRRTGSLRPVTFFATLVLIEMLLAEFS